jgi:predicted GIY-YIG superfamily endonuclease
MTDTLWYCYLARCCDGSLYVGITTDLHRRMAEHNAGRGAKYTRSSRPITLVWWECCATQSAALKREAAVRTWRKSHKEALIFNWLHASTTQVT